jgi:hypothetical protein
MIQRCINPKLPAYKLYGGRGITVCDEWRRDYKAFLRDMGRVPHPGWHIDRINNDGNYEPSNCRWVSPKDNNRNRSNTSYMEVNGEKLPRPVWAERLGISYNAINGRTQKGWSPDEIVAGKRLNSKRKKPLRKLTHDGLSLTVSEWAVRLDVPLKTLRNRVNEGWTDEEIVTGKRLAAPTPRKDTRWITHDGVTRSLCEWARVLGVPQSRLRYRYDRGLPGIDITDNSKHTGEL